MNPPFRNSIPGDDEPNDHRMPVGLKFNAARKVRLCCHNMHQAFNRSALINAESCYSAICIQTIEKHCALRPPQRGIWMELTASCGHHRCRVHICPMVAKTKIILQMLTPYYLGSDGMTSDMLRGCNGDRWREILGGLPYNTSAPKGRG